MELRELKYIASIGKKQNMAQAAQELYISQQALYKSLRKIEDELGTTLFYRRENELLPTDTGQIVLEKSTKIFKYINQMHDEIAATKNLEQGKSMYRSAIRRCIDVYAGAAYPISEKIPKYISAHR